MINMKRGREARKERREAAEARQAERNKRTDAQQLKMLQNRGHGHCREAKAINERLLESTK